MKTLSQISAWIARNWKRLIFAIPVLALATLLIRYCEYRQQTTAIPELFVGPVEFQTLPLPLARTLSPIRGARSSGDKMAKLLEEEPLGQTKDLKQRLRSELRELLAQIDKEYHEKVDPYVKPLRLTVVISNGGGRSFVVEDLRVFEAALHSPPYKERPEKDITSTVNFSPVPPLHVSPSGSATVVLELPYDSRQFIEDQLWSMSSEIGLGATIEHLEVRAVLSTGQTLTKRLEIGASFRQGVREPSDPSRLF